MRDPFPIPPPQPLVSAVKPLADALSLSTLPLHAHEVISAFFLYTFTCTVISPTLSNYFCGPRYRALNRRTKINWDVHVVSFVQSCIICTISLAIVLGDEERKAWRDSSRWEDRLWGYSGLTGLCQSFALGYFLWDLVMCSWYVNIFGWAMLAHAISAVSVFALGYRPFLYFYCPVFLLYELSSPFLNIHWFCDKLDLTSSTIQAVNGGFLTSVFFCSRIVWGLFNSYHVFCDLYTAYKTGHSVRPGPLGEDAAARNRMSGDISLYHDVKRQQQAFMGENYLPLWLPIVYVMSNLVLNALNIWWFHKMIETLRKRFDPPFGTKGVGPDAVHYEPQENTKVEKVHQEGKGSVTAGRKMAEQAMAADGDLVEPVFEGLKVERGVYADGHTSVEVSGTQRRSARSRRKA